MKISLARIALPLAIVSASCAGSGFALKEDPSQPTAPAPTFHRELLAYWRALEKVCETSVTPELIQLYEATVRAVDAAGYGAGRGSNFWGPRDPELAWRNCFEAPSIDFR